MRFLGFLFIIALVVGAVGYFRGWFSVVTVHAGGKDEITLAVDNDKIRDDADAAAVRLGRLTAKAAEAVKGLARNVGSEESELDGTLTAVDRVSRSLTVTASSQTIDLRVPDSVPITRDGVEVGFEPLHPTMRVRLGFKHAGSDRRLARIEILH